MTRKLLKEISINNNKCKIILTKYNITPYYQIILKEQNGKEESLTINPQNTKIKPKKNNVLINNNEYIKFLVNEKIVKQDSIHIINNANTCGEFEIIDIEDKK